MDDKPVASPRAPRAMPLPYALYDSGGMLFELYQGGRPFRKHEIVWRKLQPVMQSSPDTVAKNK